MNQYKPYAEYKDSGVEWAQRAPAHWTLSSLGHHATFAPRPTLGEKARDTLVSFLPMSAVGTDGSLDLSDSRQFSELDGAYTFFREGDLCYAKVTPCFENGKGAVLSGLVGEMGFGSSELTVLTPNDKSLTPLLKYYLIMAPFRQLGTSWMSGTAGLQRVPDRFAKSFPFFLPPLPEQQAIATFLDRETQKIDALIEKKSKFIELLEEKRQAFISHAVTKGLNPDAPMKDSGVPWLGEVPAHWEVKRLSRVSNFAGGGTPSKDKIEYWNGNIPWVSPKDMKSEWLNTTQDYITELGVEMSSTNIIPAGTPLIVTRSGILRHTIPVAILTKPMAVNQDIKAFLVDERHLVPEFFLRWIQGLNPFLLFDWTKEGPTVESVEHSYVARTLIPLPSLKEQTAITQYAQKQLKQINSLMVKSTASIDLLREKRSALITAAVTGQIDVREEVLG